MAKSIVWHDPLSLRPASLPSVRCVAASGWGWAYSATKRALDLVGSGLGLIVASPLMLAVALWVRLDTAGPVIYRQTRLGKGGREFEVLKFRTMGVDAETACGPKWAVKDDPRITRCGRVLRKLYLDELPQLVNILKGEMSFVGPRPERPFFYPECETRIPGFSRRLSVKPGLTGLAQVRQTHQDNLRAMRRKFTYDMMYVRKRSLGLDVAILFDTLQLLGSELKELKR